MTSEVKIQNFTLKWARRPEDSWHVFIRKWFIRKVPRWPKETNHNVFDHIRRKNSNFTLKWAQRTKDSWHIFIRKWFIRKVPRWPKETNHNVFDHIRRKNSKLYF